MVLRHIICLTFILFKLIIDIINCNNNNASIGIIPLKIDIPVSDMGTEAKSAIIIAITNSNGCICPNFSFPHKPHNY